MGSQGIKEPPAVKLVAPREREKMKSPNITLSVIN
jgi:hypothetical protein